MSEHITHTPGIKRLERSSSDRILAGVSSGLGRYFDLNPAFFRIGFVVLTLLGGAGFLVYIAAALVIPDERKERSLAEQILAERRERPWPLVGLALAAVALAVLVSHATLWPGSASGWWVLVLIVGLFLVAAKRGGRRFGLLMGFFSALTALVLAAAIAAVALAFSWFNVSLGDGVGDRVYSPATTSAVKSQYSLGVGNLRVDLSNIGPVTRETQLRAKVGVGELRVIVPNGVAVAVNAHAKLGDVYVLNRHDDGRNAEVHTGSGLIVIDANVGFGRIDVERAAG